MTASQRPVVRFDGAQPGNFHGIVGNSAAIRTMTGKILALSAGRSTILIVGESGTGKELVARAMHEASSPHAPFVALNCAALPRDLIESELFGFVKGAFSGANHDQVGLFRSAQGGTLFLDEITEMSPETQAKLLRVIQERAVRPVGGTREIPVDVRIIASTNREPDRAVREGQLRKDLYYRLAVGIVRVAPLRDRIDDIPLLVRHFVELLNAKLAKSVSVSAIEANALELLMRHSWPGNVRELANAVEAAMSFTTSDVIKCEDLSILDTSDTPAPERASLAKSIEPQEPVTFSSLKEVERNHIVWTLYNTGGNKALAARLLGISRKSLYDRLAEHGLADSIRSATHAAALRNLATPPISDPRASRIQAQPT
jgi:transcriptional regulator with PAS, ATPase and Fis domain